MTDLRKVQTLMDETRKLPMGSPEWHRVCEKLEAALGLSRPVHGAAVRKGDTPRGQQTEEER